MTTDLAPPSASVDLFWLPLGAGDTSPVVRWSGRAFEAIAAHHQDRSPCDLYHSALEVRVDGERHVIEMVPVWADGPGERGVVGEGPVAVHQLGRARLFRYEVHSWVDGVIPDVRDAVDSPVRVDTDPGRARQVLSLVHEFPTSTWGRDELGAGEMWNSNSLTSWLLAASGHATGALVPPAHGRAPGWDAGLVVAARRGHSSLPDGSSPARAGSARRHRLGGATRQEAAAVMAGDELLEHAPYRTTHAIDIDTPADGVWPWLVQMGLGRGGLYSYDWLENLVGLDIHSADEVVPALQDLAVGDVVRLTPEGSPPELRFTVAQLERPHLLVLGPATSRRDALALGLPHPCWTFRVDPRGPGRSRLVVRFQCDFEPTRVNRAAYAGVLKPVHLVMELKMMRGIRHRAERHGATG